MRCLDLFCGLGGWSEGFNAEGFKVLGVDIVNNGYPFDMILADVRGLDPSRFKGFDVIVGSPPCRDFSTATQINKSISGRTPPQPEEGLKLIEAFNRFVCIGKPKIHFFENVARLMKFYQEPPIWEFYISKRGKRCLWGNLDLPLMPHFYNNRLMESDPAILKKSYRMRSALRAKIPFAISQQIAKICRSQVHK